MRFTPWATRLALTLGLSATAFLTACGSGGSGDTAQVRLLNATLTQPSLDLVINSAKISTGVTTNTVGSYGDVNTATTTGQIQTTSAGTSVSAVAPSLTGGTSYTMIAYNSAGVVRNSVIQENVDAPASGSAKLLVLNLAPDAGGVDIYVLSSTDSASTAVPLVTNNTGGGVGGYNSLNAGTFRVLVTGTGVRNDVRLDIPAVTLDSASVNTLVLSNTVSGSLLNGTQLVQKGAAKPFQNTLTRVRAINAMPGTSVVSSSVTDSSTSTTTTILSASKPPNVSNYVTFKAGAGTVTVTIDGTPVVVPATSFVAGTDYTLLACGACGSTRVSQLQDDNTLPAVSGNVKIRLINGLSDPSATATLNVNSQDVPTAINVAPGATSLPYSSNSYANGGNGVPVIVTSPASPTGDPVWVAAGTPAAPGNTVLTANGVYTVIVMGDAGAARGRLSKDR